MNSINQKKSPIVISSGVPKRTKSRDLYLNGAFFVLPLLLFVTFLVLIPVLGTIFNSFFNDVSFMEKEFTFLKNYQQLFTDKAFWNSISFTLLFTFVSVPLQMILGLFFAMLLNYPIPGRGLLRACVLIPWVIPTAVGAKIWELIYNYGYGLANYLFLKFGLATGPINWMGSSAGAFFSLVLADTWKTAPFVALIILAGLSAIPEEIYLQAQVDGTNFVQRFFKITLPLLRPIIVVALLFRTIDALRIFDLIYVLTHGGPGGTTTSLSLYSYKYFVIGDFGYGSTISFILFIVALVLSVLYVKYGKFYQEIHQ